jgi:glutaconate CoA-transferase subunit B
MDFTQQELLIGAIARMLDGLGHIAVGVSSPIPGSAALLTRELSGGRTRVSILGSPKHNAFTDGGVELFDCAAQGRIDAFFLSGGQIDGQGNVNLVGTGDYPTGDVRWSGSFGSAYLYHLVPRVILFREEHSPRVFVPKVDFVSAPGTSPPNVYRKGGPHALVTGKAVLRFDKDAGRFRLQSVHPGITVEDVVASTGFEFDIPDSVPDTPPPPADWLTLLRGPVADGIGEIYPAFAASAFGTPQAQTVTA